ncbi:MAG: PAS domain-containing protein, partial [Methylocystaceae bacterium]|nr:PAS domain-containing protein [Methylocystaceae bacterium]
LCDAPSSKAIYTLSKWSQGAMNNIAHAGILRSPIRNMTLLAIAGFAVVLISLGAFALYFEQVQGELLAIGLVAILATIGAFCLFAILFGYLSWFNRDQVKSIFLQIIDRSSDAYYIIDSTGRLIFYNPAYLKLSAVVSAREIQAPEGMFAHVPGVSQALFRLSQAASKGRIAQEEIRIDRTLQGQSVSWYRISTTPFAQEDGQSLQVWRIADVTDERQRQDSVFRELQHAIDYLDHAPSGFFSVSREGEIVYLNATLADRLGFDLAASSSGGLRIDQLFNQAELHSILKLSGPPGESQTDVIDTDIRAASGEFIPVRLYHQWAFDANGSAQPSRTLVID